MWDILNGLSITNLFLLWLFIYLLNRYISETTVINLTPVVLRDRDGLIYIGLIDFEAPNGYLLWFLYQGVNGNHMWMVRKQVEYNGTLYYGMFRHIPLENEAEIESRYRIIPNTWDPVQISCLFVPIKRSRWVFLKGICNIEIKTGFYSDISINPLSPSNFRSMEVFGEVSDVRPHSYEV